jgi:hypothetical protein
VTVGLCLSQVLSLAEGTLLRLTEDVLMLEDGLKRLMLKLVDFGCLGHSDFRCCTIGQILKRHLLISVSSLLTVYYLFLFSLRHFA